MVLDQLKSENKIVVICITRDENDLFSQWFSHHSALDGVAAIAVVDHLSKEPINKGSFQLNKTQNFHLYTFSDNNYFQAHILNAVVKDLIVNYKNVIFFPLDTDEFLSQHAVNSIRSRSGDHGYLDWRMAWPVNAFDTLANDVDSLQKHAFKFMSSGYLGNKHYMRSVLIEKGYSWSQGAHEIFSRLGFTQKSEKIGNMIHIPVRSPLQINKKFGRGFNAHLDKALNKRDKEGSVIYTKHWKIRSELLDFPHELVKDAIQRYLPSDAQIIDGNLGTWSELFDASLFQ